MSQLGYVLYLSIELRMKDIISILLVIWLEVLAT